MVRKKQREKSIVEATNDNYILIPGKSFGPYLFNDRLEHYPLDDFEHTHGGEGTMVWDSYDKDCSFSIDSFGYSGKIDSITCFTSCILDGKELIGMDVSDFVNYFKVQITRENHIYVEWLKEELTSYLVDTLGLLIWCWEGTIIYLDAFNFIEGSEEQHLRGSVDIKIAHPAAGRGEDV